VRRPWLLNAAVVAWLAVVPVALRAVGVSWLGLVAVDLVIACDPRLGEGSW
jgi:hypothetical protein